MAVLWVVISIKNVVVSQLLIALRAERRSDGFYAVSYHVFGVWSLGVFQCRQLASLAYRTILV